MKDISIKGKQVPAVLLGAVLILAGAGAAAGVTMQGSVQGDTTTKVDQAIVVENLSSPDNNNTNNALGTAGDDGTAFKHSANVNQGDKYKVNINLTNNGNQAVNGRLVLDVPQPLEVEVDGNDNTTLARTSMYEWQFEIDNTTPVNDEGDITLTIATPDDVEPGFYTIEGEIRPEEV